MPIYYPEEGHQLVRYDGKTIHYAVAVPEGEARYVMDRKTGKIRTVKGPTDAPAQPGD
jgi:major vault protein